MTIVDILFITYLALLFPIIVEWWLFHIIQWFDLKRLGIWLVEIGMLQEVRP